MFAAITDGNRDVAQVGVMIDHLRESVFQKVFDDVQAGRVGGNGLQGRVREDCVRSFIFSHHLEIVTWGNNPTKVQPATFAYDDHSIQ